MKKYLVVTTINYPNIALEKLSNGAKLNDYEFVIVGDLKTPQDFFLKDCHYLNIEQQGRNFKEFSNILPFNHYSRKNLGYLFAINSNADIILETDDDNIPYDNFFNLLNVNSFTVVNCENNWFNIYSAFTESKIWPRGFPLENINEKNCYIETPHSSKALIVQGLADENPDVDAIYRLTCTLPIRFKQRNPIILPPNIWCPFNSQNTLFHKETFPLLYLPSTCSFRMTDILRSFIAQRCLWEIGEGIVFTSPTVYQERNLHNLLRDFRDEIDGYLSNEKIRQVLEDCKLDNDMQRNIFICYEQLSKYNLILSKELEIVKSWNKELDKILD